MLQVIFTGGIDLNNDIESLKGEYNTIKKFILIKYKRDIEFI